MGKFLFLFLLLFFCFDVVPFVGDPQECRGDVVMRRSSYAIFVWYEACPPPLSWQPPFPPPPPTPPPP